MAIHQVGRDFDFGKVHLATPVPIQNGTFFTKINHTAADDSLFVYTPRCSTKGLVTSGTKTYMDLVFTAVNTNFLEWVHSLEEKLQTLVYEKRDRWFSEELEMDDVQSVFMPMLKVHKGLDQYVMRVYIQQGKRLAERPPQVFDENETPRTLTDVRPGAGIIAILDVQGIKFSQKSFVVNVNVKQLMIVDSAPEFSQCLIKPAIIKDIEVDTRTLDEEPLMLRRPEEVYSGIYRNAMEKGRKAQQESEESFKMALQLKKEHNLEIDDD
jgi:hypothetical protein